MELLNRRDVRIAARAAQRYPRGHGNRWGTRGRLAVAGSSDRLPRHIVKTDLLGGVAAPEVYVAWFRRANRRYVTREEVSRSLSLLESYYRSLARPNEPVDYVGDMEDSPRAVAQLLRQSLAVV